MSGYCVPFDKITVLNARKLVKSIRSILICQLHILILSDVLKKCSGMAVILMDFCTKSENSDWSTCDCVTKYTNITVIPTII